MFGHGVRRVGRHTNHGQAKAFRRRQVDMVVTRRTQGNQPRATGSEALEHRGAEVVIDERADHFVLLGQRRRIEAEPRRLKMQFKPGRAVGGEEAVAIVGLTAEKDCAHESSWNIDAGRNGPRQL